MSAPQPRSDGRPFTAVTLDPENWTVHFEADAKDRRAIRSMSVADGKLENIGSYNRTITGTWTEGGGRAISRSPGISDDVAKRACSAVGLLCAASLAAAFATRETGKNTPTHEKARSLFLDACTACHTLERVREPEARQAKNGGRPSRACFPKEFR